MTALRRWLAGALCAAAVRIENDVARAGEMARFIERDLERWTRAIVRDETRQMVRGAATGRAGAFATGGVVPQGGTSVAHVHAGDQIWPAGRLPTPEIRKR